MFLNAIQNKVDSRRLKDLRHRLSEEHLALILLAPALVLIAALFIYPLLFDLFYSFTNRGLLAQGYQIVGLDNYAKLFSDPAIRSALSNNIVYAMSTTAVATVLGLGIALVLNEDFRGRGIAVTLILFPYLIPTIVVTTAFQWLLNPQYGIINRILLGTGITQSAPAWSSKLAMVTVIFATIWKFTPFVVLLCLAKLQTVPESLYEAAMVEGASIWHRFRYVTLPQLKDVLFIAIILRFIWVFNFFDIIWLLTGGGPVEKTTTLPILIYKTMFSSFRIGYASSMAMLVIGLLVVAIRIYLQVGGETYE